jgi:hypothetical protein
VFKKSKIVFAAAPILTLAAIPALASGLLGAPTGRGAPGPIAGAGLVYLLLAGGVAGGYYLYRRRKQNSRG